MRSDDICLLFGQQVLSGNLNTVIFISKQVRESEREGKSSPPPLSPSPPPLPHPPLLPLPPSPSLTHYRGESTSFLLAKQALVLSSKEMRMIFKGQGLSSCQDSHVHFLSS